MASRLRLADLLAGLSLIADTGYGLSPGHAMRSCLIAVALARKLGLPESEVSDTFYTSLLFHVGCVGFSHELSGAFGDDIAANRAGARTNFADPRDIFATLIPQTTRGLPPMARARVAAFITLRGRAFGRSYDTTVCEVARHTARRIGLPDSVQRSLYEVREWWNGGGAPQGLRGEQILLPARIARVATDSVLFADIGDARLAVAALRQRAGGVLDPSLVEEFAGHAPALLAEANTGDPRQRVLQAEPQPLVETEIAELPQVAAAFGDLVDLKTPFTHGHSGRVADLAKAAAATLGFDLATANRLHVAAFLHDIGRVGVPNSVWESAEPLTSVQWEQVRMHPYHSERILATSQTLEPMARLAGMHHERLDGSGYYRGCRAGDLTPAARVLAAADAFQTMTEERPHRPAVNLQRAAEELRNRARAGALDPDAVAAVIDAAGQRGERRLRPADLSAREVEVLRMMARASTNREIAQLLSISPRTAEHHVQHIYAKIGVSTRSAAALFAIEHDLLPPPKDG